MQKYIVEQKALELAIVRHETVVRKGKEYSVAYVTKESLSPFFGYVCWCESNTIRAYVRDDLPFLVKSFVKEHELYHLRDPYCWGGVFGLELRANIIPGFKKPLGLILTIGYTLFSTERLSLYFDRIMSKY